MPSAINEHKKYKDLASNTYITDLMTLIINLSNT